MEYIYYVKLKNGDTIELRNVVEIKRYIKCDTALEIDKVLGIGA